MNPQEAQKIFLSSTSTVSLHDRFTGLLKHQQADPINVTARVNQQNTATLKNQRLALDMANRPSVLAALRNTSNINRLCKVNVKARLGQPLGGGGGLNDQISTGGGCGQIKAFYGRRGIGRLHGTVPVLGVQRRRGQKRRGGYVNWTGPMGIRGGAIRKTGINSSPVCTGSGAYLGKDWAKFNSNLVPSRDELDDQLDEYMSKTKSHLDAELDAYMAEVDLEDIM
ncbi:chromatin target of PRMT1b [Triplophysa dalaica]|uniref:chromatin target of PRMT1b n=1 Tax=Triplophysa dalaica TaxID=1582913 RepID=UPI0024DF9061|nr:chromatin target of PRMT1b [Triplophysa dalaica]XP_056618016.1 chromatin target of PRMT1b [Triplophysa dalaica]